MQTTTLYRRLVGPGEDADAPTLAHSCLRPARGGGRPLVVANFVSSLDGHTILAGQSRRLSGPADRELFYALREQADAVLVGARTLAAERYKRMLPDAAARARRTAAGRPAEPLAVTLTRSGQLPLEIPLFAEPQARVLVFARTAPLAARLAASVVHAPLAPLDELLATLRAEHGVETLLCEGGPALFGQLVRDGLVDELLLTLAPLVAGGPSGPAVVSGPPPRAPRCMRLVAAFERDGTLFTRYAFAG